MSIRMKGSRSGLPKVESIAGMKTLSANRKEPPEIKCTVECRIDGGIGDKDVASTNKNDCHIRMRLSEIS